MPTHPDDEELDDGFGSNHFARESAAINHVQGHGYGCAQAAGGDCTCGKVPFDYSEDIESAEPTTAAEQFGMWTPSGDDVPVGRPVIPSPDDDCPF